MREGQGERSAHGLFGTSGEAAPTCFDEGKLSLRATFRDDAIVRDLQKEAFPSAPLASGVSSPANRGNDLIVEVPNR